MSSVTCPICSGPSSPSGEKAGYQLFRCADCGFLFVSPYPTPEDLETYYSDNYRGAQQTHYPKLKSRRRRAFVKSIRFLPLVFRKRVLDIGCGGGIMADAFRRMGADAHGLDISCNSIDFARAQFPWCTFYCESFEQMMQRDLKFEFIFSSNLLEHIAGPHGFFKLVASTSKPGTLVYVATPDAGHRNVPDDLLSWVDICPPEHIQWFNTANMERIFNDYGFDLIKTYRKQKPALSMIFKRQVG